MHKKWCQWENVKAKGQHKSAFVGIKQHANWSWTHKGWLQNFWNIPQWNWSLLPVLLLSVYLQRGFLSTETQSTHLWPREAQPLHNCSCQLLKRNNSSWVTSLASVIYFAYNAFRSQRDWETRLGKGEHKTTSAYYCRDDPSLGSVYYWCTQTLTRCIYMLHKNCYVQASDGLGDANSFLR